MSEKEELGIQSYLKGKIEEIDCRNEKYLSLIESKHTKQRRFFIGIITTLVAGLGLLVYSQITSVAITKQITIDNKERIDLTNQAIEFLRKTSISVQEYNQVNRTYDLEFQAVLAICNGDGKQLEKIMQQFKDFRWDIINGYKSEEVKRGIDLTPN